jgi:hypothetical protein
MEQTSLGAGIPIMVPPMKNVDGWPVERSITLYL